MSNYNSQLQSNNTDLQTVLQILQTKAAGGITPSGSITITENGTHDVKNYANAVVNVESSSGNTDIEDRIVDGTLTEYTNDRVTAIRNYAFYYYYSLTTASFPACTAIGSWAFDGCSNLTTASFPVCSYIDCYAFYDCSKLTTISFPTCTDIGHNAFDGCSNLTTVSFPVCTDIGHNAFARCSNLTTTSFPVCTDIDYYAFGNCSKLTTVSFPKCTNIGNNAFYACSRLTSASFPACTNIGNNVFGNCYTLSSLTLGASTVCTLTHSNAFSSTPYAGYKSYFSGTPYIYVPPSLVASYKAATNWTYFSSYFSAIDGYVDDGDNGNSGGSTNLITFTIDISSHQAPEGMTWAEWVDSEYNTGRYYIEGDKVHYNNIMIISGVKASDIIISGAEYLTDFNLP